MMEQMLANMLGITPEQMAEMAAGMQALLRDGVAQLNKIEADTAAIRVDTAAIRAMLEAQNGHGTADT